MKQANLKFSLPEYQARLEKTRQAMEARGIDVLICSDPSNMNWLTGYDGWSFYVHQGVILTMDGEPRWWGRYMDSLGALRTCWIAPGSIHGYADSYVQSTVRHPMQDLARILRDLGLEKARIGVEMENYYYSAKAHATLLEELPGATFVDATALVNWQRLIKSDEEITFIRKAASVRSGPMTVGRPPTLP